MTSYEKEERSGYLKNVQTNPYFKGAYGMSLLSIMYYNQQRSEENRYKICKEVILNVPVVIYTRKNFFLIDAINDLIRNLKSAGLIEFWNFEEVDKKLLKLKKNSEPKVLTTFHLIGCFHVLFTGALLSFLIFLFEIFIHKSGRMCMKKFFRMRRLSSNFY